MLILTEPKVLHDYLKTISTNKFQETTDVYNINANTSEFTFLNIMPSPALLPRISNPEEFDKEYVNYIMLNDSIFIQFMRILISLAFGKDVILLIYKEESTFDPITEVIVKFIQQRYGYNYILADDLSYIEQFPQSSFTTEGLVNYQQDFNRYWSIMERLYPQMATHEVIHDEHL